MTLPKLTLEQKREALEKAQRMRSQRAALRAKLKSGELTLRDVLESNSEEAVARMRVSYLLQSLPQVGKVTTNRIMREIGIHENRRVQGLGKRQVNELLD